MEGGPAVTSTSDTNSSSWSIWQWASCGSGWWSRAPSDGDNTLRMAGSGPGTTTGIVLKFVLVGDVGVGKSWLGYRFVHGCVISDISATIGVHLRSRKVTVDGQLYIVSIWDTAGAERFRAIIPSYYRDTDCALCVYDVTRQDTFSKMNWWLEELKTNTSGVPVAVVGNKRDLDELREVPKDQLDRFANNNLGKNDLWAEVSAKDGQGVEELFMQCVRAAILNKKQKG